METAIVHLETVARVETRDHTDQPVTQVDTMMMVVMVVVVVMVVMVVVMIVVLTLVVVVLSVFKANIGSYLFHQGG